MRVDSFISISACLWGNCGPFAASFATLMTLGHFSSQSNSRLICEMAAVSPYPAILAHGPPKYVACVKSFSPMPKPLWSVRPLVMAAWEATKPKYSGGSLQVHTVHAEGGHSDTTYATHKSWPSGDTIATIGTMPRQKLESSVLDTVECLAGMIDNLGYPETNIIYTCTLACSDPGKPMLCNMRLHWSGRS